MNEWHAEEPGGSKAVAHYQAETDEFLVIVTKGEREKRDTFKPMYRPTFGIDIFDAEVAGEVAERLLVQIEEEEAKAK